LGLCPRPCWGSLQRSPRLPSWNKGDLLVREGRDAGKGRRGRLKEGREERARKVRRGKGGEGEIRYTHPSLLPAPLQMSNQIMVILNLKSHTEILNLKC